MIKNYYSNEGRNRPFSTTTDVDIDFILELSKRVNEHEHQLMEEQKENKYILIDHE